MTPTYDFSAPGTPTTVILNPQPNAMVVTSTGRALPGRASATVTATDSVVMRLIARKMVIEQPQPPVVTTPVEAAPRKRTAKAAAEPAVEAPVDDAPAAEETPVEETAGEADPSDLAPEEN